MIFLKNVKCISTHTKFRFNIKYLGRNFNSETALFFIPTFAVNYAYAPLEFPLTGGQAAPTKWVWFGYC